MNSYHIAIIAHMRMCIILRRFSVSCPTGMPDSTGSRYRVATIGLFDQFFQAAFGFDHLCLFFPVSDCDTGRVISTVFQFGQSIQ